MEFFRLKQVLFEFKAVKFSSKAGAFEIMLSEFHSSVFNLKDILFDEFGTFFEAFSIERYFEALFARLFFYPDQA